MKLKEYNPQNSSCIRTSQVSIAANITAGRFTFNKSAVEFLRLTAGDQVKFFQDEEDPICWYITIAEDGVSDKTILTYEGVGRNRKAKLIPNTPRLSQMILLCPKHIAGYFEFDPIPKRNNQLTLF